MSAAKQASMDSARTTWRTRSGSAPAWDCAYGAAPTLASTTSAWSPNPRANPIRRPCASLSGNCGEAYRSAPRDDPAARRRWPGGPFGVERTRSRLFLRPAASRAIDASLAIGDELARELAAAQVEESLLRVRR